MSSEVRFLFEGGEERVFGMDDMAPMAADVARWWLDDQFVRLDCEPLRPTGKVLIADKAICIARAAGLARFSDMHWGSEFARAVHGALSRPRVVIDVAAMTVSY
ncbi:hypothetical protein PY257_06220 [Ramlibacter sp. H39-3-26]|uniref:hypothetical protein n=1 Tax=Curvibacter soli TaxID=3031331 RepID=UPI0023DB60B8|nr:hypothetical protein [Ramlibacter sp. H39-3-26]MDF1484784.1 hypothetical protein [Ramlibacter sp. H39-3-26]